MSELMIKISKAEEIKPAFGDDCNHCGWCCMTEVCEVGREHGAGEMLPCKYLDKNNLCGLAIQSKENAKLIGTNVGCCAMTQREMINQLI